MHERGGPVQEQTSWTVLELTEFSGRIDQYGVVTPCLLYQEI